MKEQFIRFKSSDRTGTNLAPEASSASLSQKYTWRSWHIRIAVSVLFLVIWFVLTIGENISPVILPSPSRVAKTFWKLLTIGYQDNTLIQHSIISIVRILEGFVWASFTGILLGFFMSSNKIVMSIFDPIIQFLTPIPPLIYIPLLQVWFGIGELPKVLLIYICTLPFVVIGTVSGIRSTKESMIRMSQCFGANSFQTFRYVILPSALPEIITSLRLSLGRSWTCVVAAEMIAASSGLGWIGNMAGLQLQTDVVFVAVLCIAILGFTMDMLLRWIHRSLVFWDGKY
ncbi:ABC transporter permease [Paenibacillaceae bacterium]|nr:ABC transporter permease [Paenibacillaceae bacterium]